MAVFETFPLGNQWPTVDPFLFVAHHRDAYPAGNDELGPDADVRGRPLGSDFGDIDGWNMYHGRQVPGFPQHPHRGFETITWVRTGLIDHSDSMGATARFAAGDVQWMTAGSGVVHSEMFPLVRQDGDNPLELFQIWLNLPASDKFVDPYFTMLWSEGLPVVRSVDENGRATEISVLVGALGDAVPASPPPDSWAARPDTGVALWHIALEPGAQWALPAVAPSSADEPDAPIDVARVLYLFDDGGATVDGRWIDGHTGVAVDADKPTTLIAGDTACHCLMMQGRPIREPVAQYGPFVMNGADGVRQAMADYQATQFGGWPWDRDDPVHPRDAGRFAVHPDGRREVPGDSDPSAVQRVGSST